MQFSKNVHIVQEIQFADYIQKKQMGRKWLGTRVQVEHERKFPAFSLS